VVVVVAVPLKDEALTATPEIATTAAPHMTVFAETDIFDMFWFLNLLITKE
jgi:hypothetical protein